MKATLTSKGQITIPARIRKKLGFKPGQVLDFDETVPYLKATKVIDPKAWDAFRRGAKPKGRRRHPWDNKTALEILEETRGPVK